MKTKKISDQTRFNPPPPEESSVRSFESLNIQVSDHPSLSFLHSLIHSVSLPVMVIGADKQIKFINSAAEILFGDRVKQYPIGTDCFTFMYDYNNFSSCLEFGKTCPLVECRETMATLRTEYCLNVEDETPQYYEIISSPIFNEDGKFLGIVQVFYDITDWKLFEKWLKVAQKGANNLLRERTAKLLESNKSLRREVQERQQTEMALLRATKRSELLYRVIPSAIFTVDLERRITSWNDKAEAVTGYSREDMIGQPCSIFALYPCTAGCRLYSDETVKPIVGCERIIRTKDGPRRIVSVNGDLLYDDDGNVIGAVESFEDVTDIKMSEAQLSSERDKLKSMLSAMGHGMHIISLDFDIEYQNDIALKAFGDIVGNKCYWFYKERRQPCENCLMHQAIQTNAIQHTEIVLANNRQYDISYAPFKDVDGQVKALSLLRDVTEEKKMQAEALRAVQLASVGELAAGVAHEINNPINGIINYAQIIQDEAADNELLVKFSEKIIREGERVASIVSNLLSFARQQDEESDKIYLNQVIMDAVDLIRHQLSKNCILLELDLPVELPPIFGNHHQLQQVFLNMFSNARFALNQKYAGKDPQKKIIITGQELEEKDRKFVRIIFTDLGTGIPGEIAQKIFEPFFSTKMTGEGTGLGLSISREIIAKHDGSLQVESQEGEYTSMIIDIPVYPGPPKYLAFGTASVEPGEAAGTDGNVKGD
ncbi:MAG: PAS domain-containing protein [Desulfobulbaceae bacterium]|jgi:PAS domain S-box-containing protein|nr:PAS domain-containing protein [Desulfobulbaceae bacterium]MDY0349884.1 PAS domain-containing protein [Desulfobulbaceae bacterium]